MRGFHSRMRYVLVGGVLIISSAIQPATSASRAPIPLDSNTSEVTVSYEQVTGAHWKTIPEQTVGADLNVHLSNVARGLIIVNTQNETHVKGNSGYPAGGGTQILWRLGSATDLQECSTNVDSDNEWWDPYFLTSNTCIIPIEAPTDLTLVIRPVSFAQQGVVSQQKFSARYLVLRTQQ